MAGKPWYNNGEVEIQRGQNEYIPDGFIRGRLPPKEDTVLKWKQSLANRTEQEKELSNQKRSDTLKQVFADKSQEEKDKTIAKRKATWNNKSEQEINDYKAKLSQSSIGKNKGKEPWNKGLTKETDDRVRINAEHTAQTVKANADLIRQTNPDYFHQWRTKMNDIMKVNNSFNRSLPEDNYYTTLVSKYGSDDVIRQYHDERYPYACDFYIPSEDLFIEINKSWVHGGHPFDELNLDDISKLEMWEEKAKTSLYYKQAIYIWTDLDVRKQKLAKENHLNYKVIY